MAGYKPPTAPRHAWSQCECWRKDKEAASDGPENRRTLIDNRHCLERGKANLRTAAETGRGFDQYQYQAHRKKV